MAGVILRERLPAFERMLWRACRGNVFLRQAMIESALEDPSNVSYIDIANCHFLGLSYIDICYHFRAIMCTSRCSSFSSKAIN